jgi:3-oxoacyl-[acyl-carrier protein] reductase
MTSIALNDRVVAITGGSRGLGRVMALALADAGARIALGSPEVDALRSVAEEIEARVGKGRAIAVPTDITKPEDCENILAQCKKSFGGADVLVNNAKRLSRGPGLPATGNALPFWESNPQIWCETVGVNVCGTFLMSRTFAPTFIAQGWGRIINITTSLVTMQRANNSPYGVTKAALEAATMIWAQDLANTGVTVNSLIPGGAVDFEPGMRQHRPGIGTLQPPEIMNPLVIWLASDLSNGKTGGRYVGKFWNPDLPPGEAAARALEQPVLRSPEK